MAALPLAFWAGGIIVLSMFGKLVLFAEKKTDGLQYILKTKKKRNTNKNQSV